MKIQPSVLQVELNYFLPQPELIEVRICKLSVLHPSDVYAQFAKENGIIVQAYSPLGSDGRVGQTLTLPVVKEIAAVTGQTPAQVIISWHVQRGVSVPIIVLIGYHLSVSFQTVVLPKSVTPSRIVENYHGKYDDPVV